MDLSPFGRLSAEISNEIYALCFQADCEENRDEVWTVYLDKYNSETCMALIHTCRLMRQESRAMFWSEKSLSKDITSYKSVWTLCKFVKALGPDILGTMSIREQDVRHGRFNHKKSRKEEGYYSHQITICFSDREGDTALKEVPKDWLPSRIFHYINEWAWYAQAEIVDTLADMKVKVNWAHGLDDVYDGEDPELTDDEEGEVTNDEEGEESGEQVDGG